MPASVLLRRHWRRLPDRELAQALCGAESSVQAFAAATDAHGSLLQSWIRGAVVHEFDHHPPDDIVDLRSGSQFYYHSHRQGGLEHGHLHLFWHATASGRRRYPRAGRMGWSRSAPTHLFAISLDARGLPVALFTVNQWVTDGHWFDAPAILEMIDRFRAADAQHRLSCDWLNGFVAFYRPAIAEMLRRRDRRLACCADPELARRDHRLEVLSAMEIDWMADLESLQAYSTRRARSPNPSSMKS